MYQNEFEFDALDVDHQDHIGLQTSAAKLQQLLETRPAGLMLTC